MAGDAGKVGWMDITVADGQELHNFYPAVAGLEPEHVKMGDYDDFNMKMPASGEPVVGACHARASNAGILSGWL